MSGTTCLNYDKLFPGYIRGNGCYLDELPRDVINIIYEYKYDGASVIYDDIINYRLIKDGKNIIEFASELVNVHANEAYDWGPCMDKLLSLQYELNNKELVLLSVTNYIIIYHICLYNHMKFSYSRTLLNKMRAGITTITGPYVGITVLNHYKQHLLNRIDEITRTVRIND